MRRYYSSKEELLLELAERGWDQWRDAVLADMGDRTGLDPAHTAAVISTTLASLPVFCDLLTHAPLHLEGDVDIERARRYKTNAFAAHDEIARALCRASRMTAEQIQGLLTSAVLLAAGLWQASHPTPTLARLYEQEPRWGHAALDFRLQLDRLLTASAIGLTSTLPAAPRH
ncbi:MULTISPECIES: TetR family transcriptional regulator [Streptomyces]|uniref:TetR family transcriptional regulator n=1 Tax=Streptomyces TaxID=1883 RepID=UPI0019280F04